MADSQELTPDSAAPPAVIIILTIVLISIVLLQPDYTSARSPSINRPSHEEPLQEDDPSPVSFGECPRDPSQPLKNCHSGTEPQNCFAKFTRVTERAYNPHAFPVAGPNDYIRFNTGSSPTVRILTELSARLGRNLQQARLRLGKKNFNERARVHLSQARDREESDDHPNVSDEADEGDCKIPAASDEAGEADDDRSSTSVPNSIAEGSNASISVGQDARETFAIKRIGGNNLEQASMMLARERNCYQVIQNHLAVTGLKVPIVKAHLQYDHPEILVLDLACCSLRKFFIGKDRSLVEILLALTDICSALCYLHGHHSLAHNDLHIDNCMLGVEGLFSLCDFGCAAAAEDFTEPGRGDLQEWSETFRKKAMTGNQSDILGFGVIIAKLLWGDVPHTEVWNRYLQKKFEAAIPARFRHDNQQRKVVISLIELMNRCLLLDNTTAEEVEGRLASLLQELSTSSPVLVIAAYASPLSSSSASFPFSSSSSIANTQTSIGESHWGGVLVSSNMGDHVALGFPVALKGH
jgi:hypothetical protein